MLKSRSSKNAFCCSLQGLALPLQNRKNRTHHGNGCVLFPEGSSLADAIRSQSLSANSTRSPGVRETVPLAVSEKNEWLRDPERTALMLQARCLGQQLGTRQAGAQGAEEHLRRCSRKGVPIQTPRERSWILVQERIRGKSIK